MDASLVAEMKDLAEQNRRLKKMYAEMSMQNDWLKEALGSSSFSAIGQRTMDERVKAIPAQGDGRESGREHGVSVALACRTFQISETCYRYERKLSDENEEIADWLERLTINRRAWGFGLCFLYLRNVRGFGWNHKRVYRIYCELALNLRIKRKKRLKRDRPEPLSVPVIPNHT